MNIVNTNPVFTALFAAIALGSTGLAAASNAGLSSNERSAQQAIVESPSSSHASSDHDVQLVTLSQSENAAQRVISVDFTAFGAAPSPVSTSAVALAVNEQAAQRAIVGAPLIRSAVTASGASASTTPAERTDPVVAR